MTIEHPDKVFIHQLDNIVAKILKGATNKEWMVKTSFSIEKLPDHKNTKRTAQKIKFILRPLNHKNALHDNVNDKLIEYTTVWAINND
jgi:hypothetical protein